MKTIGIVAHSAEGAGLCFLTACRAGGERLGEHLHPPIAMSAISMGLSMPGWWAGDLEQVKPHLLRGIEMVARSGADFFVCPDNTAHLALERMPLPLPLPGLHIARVVGAEIVHRGFSRVGLLGTRWTMSGSVYPDALRRHGVDLLVPDAQEQEAVNGLIFRELCNGRFEPATTARFLRAIEQLKERGAQAVILGCTEIPIIVDDRNAALPTLDSTRLLARYAVELALQGGPLAAQQDGWLAPPVLTPAAGLPPAT
ncbi:amino acid racemase [Ramlibacter sp.]|uniref:aspartate/glutamate racemase family protein n=1 Tax=Ramlibacter sp. TaxID=1917967 RepID=UPI0017F33FC6|nr:amino acid racemase [Ramlibacter sp.]MBA2673731.1 amino acid racemase [Ramlibacter sp.]